MAIFLIPPIGDAPFRRIELASGAVVGPDFANGGCVVVEKEADAAELEREGWSRTPAKAARAGDRHSMVTDLRKRFPKLDPELAKEHSDSRAEFRERLDVLNDLLEQLKKIESQGAALVPTIEFIGEKNRQ